MEGEVSFTRQLYRNDVTRLAERLRPSTDSLPSTASACDSLYLLLLVSSDPLARPTSMPIRLVDPKHPRRYKHSLRKSPYFVSLVFLLAATTLTLLNIYVSLI